jgi:hypothetical protein
LLRKELAEKVLALVNAGSTLSEAATALRMSRQRLRRLAKAFTIATAPTGLRAIRASVTPATVDSLARAARVTPAEMAERILAVLLEEGEVAVARRLGKLARPRRPYVRRANGA